MINMKEINVAAAFGKGFAVECRFPAQSPLEKAQPDERKSVGSAIPGSPENHAGDGGNHDDHCEEPAELMDRDIGRV